MSGYALRANPTYGSETQGDKHLPLQ